MCNNRNNCENTCRNNWSNWGCSVWGGNSGGCNWQNRCGWARNNGNRNNTCGSNNRGNGGTCAVRGQCSCFQSGFNAGFEAGRINGFNDGYRVGYDAAMNNSTISCETVCRRVETCS